MFGIFDSISQWFHDFLVSIITSCLTTMFTDVNERVGAIATEVGRTPQGWNGSIYSLVHECDWRDIGVKLDTLGLNGMSVEQIKSFLKTGNK